RQKITDTLAGFELGGMRQTNMNLAFWQQKAPAPLDYLAQQQLQALIHKALEELDYYEPKVNIRMAPDPLRKVVDLKVEIANEGIKGTIVEINVTGLRTNTRQQVLDFLNLKPGIELH